MKKLFPILLFLICGCDIFYVPFDIRNAYFEDVYVMNALPEAGADKIKVSDKGGQERLDHFRWVPMPLSWSGPHFEILSQRGMDGAALKVWVFQGSGTKCFLYSYTKEELLELKNKAGFSRDAAGAVFLLERTGIRVVSSEEYNKLKPTLKPYRYDPSLCKPKPDLVVK